MPKPTKDIKALKKLVTYCKKPRSIAEIMERMDISERSAYRWLEYVQELGHDVMIRKYQRISFYSVQKVKK